ncbi:MAG: hypothetical protein ABR587_06350 [Candidatus Binatia bacterium]
MIELKPHDGSSKKSDPDGVRIVAREGSASRRMRIFQGLALLLAAAGLGYVVTPRSVPPPRDPANRAGADEYQKDVTPEPAEVAAAAKPAGSPNAPAAAPASTRSVTPRRAATVRPTEPDPDEDPGELPIPMDRLKDVTAGEYIKALNDAGIYEGIGAFPPPGTSPPLEGLAVPDDYVLPEGYVRHGQATDDGQPIEPILMYSPDYVFDDANGNPVEIPEDRVVPPEHAPPGFPIRPIKIPEPREPGDTSR